MQLFETKPKTDRYTIVYNLTEIEVGLFAPNAYIVQTDNTGEVTHIVQKAFKKTIPSFGLEITKTRVRLFEIIERLNPKTLEEKFKIPRRRILPLKTLFEQVDLKNKIIKYVQSELDTFLNIIYEEKLLLCWDVEKKVLVKDVLIELADNQLVPKLDFQKLEDVVHYNLQFEDENGVWEIKSKDVVPLVNTPAWIFVDYKLYKVPHINGNMVKPFRKKETIKIPQRSVKTYFQKFILKQASKLDIEAEGFEIVKNNNLTSCQLELTRDIFSQDFGFNVKFRYDQTLFYWNEKRGKKTDLSFGEGEDIVIQQVIRNKELEEEYLWTLEDFGLESMPNNLFQLADNQQDNYSIIDWLRTNHLALKGEGFEIVDPLFELKPIDLSKPVINQGVSKNNDWFDLHIQVEVGDFVIPFYKLAKYIREGNRFYPLPNDSWFLIPLEWMSKYLALAQFGKREKEGFRLSKSQFTLLNELGFEGQEETVDNWSELEFEVPNGLQATLRPYQLEGVKWLIWNYQKNLGACLADDMGLGKTLQTITVLLHSKAQKSQRAEIELPSNEQLDIFAPTEDLSYLKPLNALIILPASLVFNWESEIKKFAPRLNVYRHTGPKRHKDSKLLVRFDVLLTTYQTALKDSAILEQLNLEYIVLDESQQIKNKDSKVFKAINRLNGQHKISLSGTPIENSLSDLWSQMQFINPGLLGTYAFFKREFISPIEKGADDIKKEQLRNMVSPFLLRRTKEQVAKDLPELDVQVFYSEMAGEQKKLYEKEKSKARNFLLENYDKGNFEYQSLVIRTLLRLRQLVNHPKLVFDDFEQESGKFKDILEQWEVITKSEHKVLIFSSFVKYLELFKNQLEDKQSAFSWLTGGVPAKKRETEIAKFQKDPTVKSFLISTKAGGTGLNLTAADYVFMLDPWWNPAAERQAIARAHRIGQTKKVFALKFITKNSIEEKILKLQERKAALAEDILMGAGKQTLSKGDLEFLLD